MNTLAMLSTKNLSKEEWLAARLRHLWQKRKTLQKRNEHNRQQLELPKVQIKTLTPQIETF